MYSRAVALCHTHAVLHVLGIHIFYSNVDLEIFVLTNFRMINFCV